MGAFQNSVWASVSVKDKRLLTVPGSPQHFVSTASYWGVHSRAVQGRGGAGGLSVLQNLWCQPAGVELGLLARSRGLAHCFPETQGCCSHLR